MKADGKTKVLYVKATEDEHNAFQRLAAKRHTNLSELIRQLLHREVATEKRKP
jgi:hypothetical protein